MTQVGQTISAEEFNKSYPVGTTLSADEFASYGKKSQDGKYDWLPAVLGTAGNVGGTILGALGGGAAGTVAAPGAGTVLGGIGGARLGGIGGSAAGQGIGEAINQILSGQPLQGEKILGEGIQGGIYGMLPGGKLTGGLIKNAATRFGGGAAVGTGTQVVRNIQEGQSPTKDLQGQAAITGLLNTAIPGAGALVGKVGGGLKQMAGSATDIAGEFAARKAAPVLDNLQHFLGKQAITTTGGEGRTSDFAKRMIDQYHLTLPPQGDAQVLRDTLKEASEQVEGQLKPYLEKFAINYSKEIRPLINLNLTKFFGTTQLGSRFKAIPPEVKFFVTQADSLGQKATLAEVKNIQREVADIVKTKDWSEPKDMVDQFGISVYSKLDDVIRDRILQAQKKKLISSQDARIYNDFMNQARFLVKAKQATNHMLNPFGVLPKTAVSESIAKGQAQMGFLGPERIKQAAIRAALLGVTGGSTFFGVPPQIAYPLMALEAAAIMPYGGESIARKMASGENQLGNFLQSVSANKNLNQALQQLGVRIPGSRQ